ARILVAHRNADGAQRYAGVLERLLLEFRMAGERRAEHDGVDLAQADLQAECRLEAVEKPLQALLRQLERGGGAAFEIDGEKRGGQADLHQPGGERRIAVAGN